MEKTKTISSRSIILMVVGALLLVGLGAVGIARATNAQLAFFSDDYVGGITQTHLGVQLTENGNVAEGDGALLSDGGKAMLGGDAQMVPGKEYPEAISVKNETDMPEYVRLTVRKYWETSEGAKDPSLDPALIELVHDDDNWVFSEGESTSERLVFYYKDVLEPNAAASSPAVSGIILSPDVLTQFASGTSARIALAAQVDSVQTSYAVDAAKSAWGVDVRSLGLAWNEGASQ